VQTPPNAKLKNPSPVNINAPDLVEFPKFRHARPTVCRLGEGDALLLPPHTWHNVFSWPRDDGDGSHDTFGKNQSDLVNMAVNYW
jgi:hypothetical protein